MDRDLREILEQPDFGRRLRVLRLARGFSQGQLAGEGMSAAYLSRLESGARPPTARALAHLCEQLGIGPSAFRRTDPHSLAQVLATVASGPDPNSAAELLFETFEREPGADPALRWHALWFLAQLQDGAGLTDSRADTLRRLVEISDEIAIPELRTRARHRYARYQRSVGDLLAAHINAAEALAIAEGEAASSLDTVRALLVLLSVEAESGRLAEADARASRLVDLLDDLPGTVRAEALWTLATLRVRQGRHALAAELLDQAVGAVASGTDLILWMRLRLASASLHLQMNPRVPSEAMERLVEVGPAVELVGTAVHKQEHLALRARAAYHIGDIEEARRCCEEMGPDPGHLQFRDRLRYQALMAQLRLHDGDRTAVADLEGLARQAESAGNTELASELWRLLAEALGGFALE
ncbi:helix-turn-helix domain-containing protein [Streptomyces decoyicus]